MVDAAGVTTLAERVDDDLELLVFDDLTSALTDPRSQANMIMFRSGWGDGSYPTWIGRTATGAISQIVVDTLILRDATLIT
jgi:hypothetical protein